MGIVFFTSGEIGVGACMKQAWKEQMAKDDVQRLTSKIGEAMLLSSDQRGHLEIL